MVRLFMIYLSCRCSNESISYDARTSIIKNGQVKAYTSKMNIRIGYFVTNELKSVLFVEITEVVILKFPF